MGHRYAIVLIDLFSRFICSRPLKAKAGLSTVNSYVQWRGQYPVQYLYTDDSQELKMIAAHDHIPHDTSEPGDPQANGIAERHVQEVKYGTAAALDQSGLPHKYW